MHEEFYIQRRPVTDQRVSSATIGDGGTIRIPLMGEQVVVDKRTFVNEEVQNGSMRWRAPSGEGRAVLLLLLPSL